MFIAVLIKLVSFVTGMVAALTILEIIMENININPKNKATLDDLNRPSFIEDVSLSIKI